MKYRALTICCLFAVAAACGLLVSCTVGFIITNVIEESSSLFWLARFVTTICNYGTIFLPCAVLIYFTKKHKLHMQDGCHWKLPRMLITGSTSETNENEHSDVAFSSFNPSPTSAYPKTVHFFICCIGLQVSYLTWGVLQEKTITQDYVGASGQTEKFTDSQFLVFTNRILVFVFSGTYLLFSHQNAHRTPLYKYSFCSLSNILSSWCQYEALKFVSFPSQVLAKSAKVIPVMLMGKLVSNAKYKTYEYLSAVLISVGMIAFLTGSMKNNEVNGNTTTVSGVTLLLGYLLFDSFTANWQNSLFKEHHPSSIQMMCGVNLMSCLLTSTSLLQQGGVYYSLSFAARYPRFILDCALTAIASASGQLFIFATISKFGPVIFTIIMTIRQV